MYATTWEEREVATNMFAMLPDPHPRTSGFAMELLRNDEIFKKYHVPLLGVTDYDSLHALAGFQFRTGTLSRNFC